VTKAEALHEIAGDWDDLADRVGGSPFLRPGWIAAWWNAFGEGHLEILDVRRRGRLAAVLPLCHRGDITRAAANEHSPEFAILAEDEAAAEELCHGLVRRRDLRRISIGSLDADGHSARALRSTAEAARWGILTSVQQRSPYIALDRVGRSTLERNARRVVADARRRRRRLEERGRLTFAVEDGRIRLEELLAEGLAIEGSGWKDARGTALRSRRATRRHYTSVANWAAHRGTLRLAFLRLDERPIAFQFALEDGGRYYFLKGGYATEYARFAPGKVLVHFTLERAYSVGLDSYEFLGAAEPWKLEWTNTIRERVLVEAFAPSPVGAVENVARSMFFRGKALAKRALVGTR
jgi:CelD/BcsL family acetyltransferase involved in cellulose biosynthesis